MDYRDKIAKLLALAKSPNENEAKAALLKARALMAAHKLCEADCVPTEKVEVVRCLSGVTCAVLTNPWKAQLAAVIARSYCCASYRTRHHGAKTVELGIIGLADDAEVCLRVYKYAVGCVESIVKGLRREFSSFGAAEVRRAVNAFGFGFAAGVSDMFRAQSEKNQEWGLVLSVPQPVTDYMAVNMGKASAFGHAETEGYRAFASKGYQHGRNFDPAKRLEA